MKATEKNLTFSGATSVLLASTTAVAANSDVINISSLGKEFSLLLTVTAGSAFSGDLWGNVFIMDDANNSANSNKLWFKIFTPTQNTTKMCAMPLLYYDTGIVTNLIIGKLVAKRITVRLTNTDAGAGITHGLTVSGKLVHYA